MINELNSVPAEAQLQINTNTSQNIIGFSLQKIKIMSKRAVIVPGNGSGDVTRSNWYSWVMKVRLG